jgi:hypothetical protein
MAVAAREATRSTLDEEDAPPSTAVDSDDEWAEEKKGEGEGASHDPVRSTLHFLLSRRCRAVLLVPPNLGSLDEDS